jgi:hypothetical protein
VLSHVLCLIYFTHPLSSFDLLSLVLSLFAMPQVDPRKEVGLIVHAISRIVLGNHTAKKIYGNVNHAKTFIQGIIMNVFDRRVPGGNSAV